MKTVAIGIQDFETIQRENIFYIDKTDFIRKWWESKDSVTLIARPRRFGKTLTMDMLNKFFSIQYQGRKDLFENLAIWSNKEMQAQQGRWPVVFLSFANVKETTYKDARKKINQILRDCYRQHDYLLDSEILNDEDRTYFKSVTDHMDVSDATASLNRLCAFLYRYYHKKVIVLLDEYDTPMQEAYIDNYWEQLTAFIRSLFNATFKTNPYLERAVMTGITKVSKESVFSDLNNLRVITTTSVEYADCFGFTEEEVFAALEEQGLSGQKQEVKNWYDGFIFGNRKDIYNPWSIIHFLRDRKFSAYWANTSSNTLAGTLIREGDVDLKQDFQTLLDGGTITTALEEQIVYDQLSEKKDAVWSLFLAAGYLKAEKTELNPEDGWEYYTLRLTNYEVEQMFRRMVSGWFSQSIHSYNHFIRALLRGDLEEMNAYMNRITQETFSYFDSGSQPERFYHGFVLGLLVDLRGRYLITSNRESGFGRYDVMLEPLHKEDDAFILEFKVFNPLKENSLEDTVRSALIQIEDKHYKASLISRGVPSEKIHCYELAFKGKNVLIG